MPLLLVTVVLAVLAGAYAIAERAGWPWARPVLVRVDDARARAWAFVSLSPATFTYLFVLLITSWVVHTSSDRTGTALLATHSTNLHNLRADPVGVLVTSAFYLSSAGVVRWVLPFVLVMAPVERWLGSIRAVIAFAVGHVVATVVVAVALDRGLVGFTDADTTRFTIDVGVSYGYYCIAALFTYRLVGRRWWPWVWAVGLSAVVLVPFATDRTFTSFGHVVTTAVGFALVPITLAEPVRRRRSLPIWAPPAATVAASRASIEARREWRRPGPEDPAPAAPAPAPDAGDGLATGTSGGAGG